MVHHRRDPSNCKVAIVMGITNPDNPVHTGSRLILVPMDAPGLTIRAQHSLHESLRDRGHCELHFKDVRVPASNLLAEEGSASR